MIEFLTALPVPALPAIAVLALIALWTLPRLAARQRWIAPAVAHVFQLAILLLVCEGIRTRMALPALLTPWLKTLEMALLAFLAVQVIVKLYIGQYIERRRRVFVARIIRDLTTVLIVTLFVLLFLRLVLNVNLATILTPSAILTAIIGLSMQDTIGSFIAGLLIQLEKPFDLGDWINIDGQRGQVREINWRYTKIETTDKLYMIIPNNRISADKLINYSKPTPAVKEFLNIGVSYEVAPIKVRQAVMAVLKANPRVIAKEECEVFLHEYCDFSIVYRIAYMIGEPSLHRAVRDEVYSAIWYQFKKNMIEIPFPIRTVIMKKPPAQADPGEAVRLLGDLALFKDVSAEGLEHLVRFGLTRAIAPGHVVVREQEAGDSMFFIMDGEFNVMKDKCVAAVLRKGDFFGEMSLLTGEKRAADVVAARQGALLEIDRNGFKILIESEPVILRQVEAIFDERCSANADLARSKTDPEALKTSLFQRFKRRFGLA